MNEKHLVFSKFCSENINEIKKCMLVNYKSTDTLTGLLYISVLVSYNNKLLIDLTDINCSKHDIGMLLIIDF
jgi:hypothetical protein